jgi:PBP1b-binding outer membrane lipoprotein LpoB
MAVCFAFVMSSASCDLFDKVDDVTLDDVELEHVFHVNETLDQTGMTYSHMEVLDAADVNSDFEKYKDKIKSITVNSVTYEILNHTVGTTTIFTNGNIGFSAAGGTSASSVASLGIENIKAAEGQVKNLNFNQTGLNEMGTLLKDDKTVNLYLMGTFSKTPVKFDVKVKVKVSITADAI